MRFACRYSRHCYFLAFLLFLLFYVCSGDSGHALATRGALVTDLGSYVDRAGYTYLVGTVENKNDVPIHVLLGLNTTSNKVNTTSVAEPYSKIIYPYGEVPFKFKLPSGSDVRSAGEPYVYRLNTARVPYYDVIRLNYSNIPLPNGTLAGSVKNIGSFDMYNLSIYASAHNRTGAQIDSVSSRVIPVLKSGEREFFSVTPDPVLESKVAFYSCFGVDFRTMNMKINIGENRYILSNMTGLATIDNIKADPSTGSIRIYVDNQYPVPGPLRLKIPQTIDATTIFVTLDGTLYKHAVASSNGIVSVDLNIPGGKHEIDVNGIR